MGDGAIKPGNSLERLEQKIDALAAVVSDGARNNDNRFTALDRQLTGLGQRLDSMDQRLDGMDKRFDGSDRQLSDIDQRLTKVHLLAEQTEAFSHNVYDSLATLTKNVDEGFKEAATDRDQKFDVAHKAILHWGERVKVLEVARTRRATKRRR